MRQTCGRRAGYLLFLAACLRALRSFFSCIVSLGLLFVVFFFCSFSAMTFLLYKFSVSIDPLVAL